MFRRDISAQLKLLAQVPVPGEEEKDLGVLQVLPIRDLVGEGHGPVAHAGGVDHIEGLLLRGAHKVHIDVDQIGQDLVVHEALPAGEEGLKMGGDLLCVGPIGGWRAASPSAPAPHIGRWGSRRGWSLASCEICPKIP